MKILAIILFLLFMFSFWNLFDDHGGRKITEYSNRYTFGTTILMSLPAALYVLFLILRTPESPENIMLIKQVYLYNAYFHVIILFLLSSLTLWMVGKMDIKESAIAAGGIVLKFMIGSIIVGLAVSVAFAFGDIFKSTK